MKNILLENSVSVLASRSFNHYSGQTSNDIHPFSLMSKPIYIKKTHVPPKPILVFRSSHTIIMKLPFYKPITDYRNWRNIDSLALYGKPSGSGVAVSLNNTEYRGTGDKVPQGSVVTVTGLQPNKPYVFAVGGYTHDGICVNGIGETCEEILTVLPLSIHILLGYLAQTSFKLRHY